MEKCWREKRIRKVILMESKENPLERAIMIRIRGSDGEISKMVKWRKEEVIKKKLVISMAWDQKNIPGKWR